MENKSPFIITISRQLGSGGAYIGQKLADSLNIFYADREIIRQAAKQLAMLEEDLASRDEKVSSFWESYLQLSAYSVTDAYIPPQIIPSDHELFKIEAEIIRRIAKERSAVIIGRCGTHVLHEHPNHVSIFLHGDIAFRKTRTQELYKVSEKTAEKMIAQSDKSRANYAHSFTRKEWADARQYDISVDTSKIGVDKSVELIFKYLELIKGDV